MCLHTHTHAAQKNCARNDARKLIQTGSDANIQTEAVCVIMFSANEYVRRVASFISNAKWCKGLGGKLTCLFVEGKWGLLAANGQKSVLQTVSCSALNPGNSK